MQPNRRRVLAVSGALLTGVAGCIEDSGTPESGGTGDDPIRWEYDVGGQPHLVHDGLVYATENFGDGTGGLVAIDTETGEREWSFGETGGYSTYTSPEVADAVYLGYGDDAIGSGSGSLHAVEHDGTERWSVGTGSVYKTPRYADGSVYATADDGTALAVDAESGSELWAVDVDDETPEPPSLEGVGDGIVYVDSDDELVAFDASDGERLWTYSDETRLSRPLVADSVAYVTSSDGVTALDADGDELWRVDHDGWVLDIVDGQLYTADRDGVCALDATDGTELWRESVNRVYHVGARGLYAGHDGEYTGTGIIQQLTHDGEIAWDATLESGELSSVSEADESVYALTDDTVYRFDDSGEKAGSESLGNIRGHAVGEIIYIGTADAMYGLALAE